jgi:diguanylate cyclase (GGDEF)-like protein
VREAAGVAQEVRRASWIMLAGVFASTLLMIGVLLVSVLVITPTRDDYVEGARAIRLAHLAMVEQQSGLRGYLSSGDAGALADRTRLLDDLASNDAEIDRRLGGDGDLARELVDFRVEQERWIAVAEQLLERDVPIENPILDEDVVEEARRFGIYRDAEQRLEQAADRQRRRLDEQQRTFFTIATLGAAGVGLLCAAIGLRRFHRLRRSVVQPVEATVEAIDHRSRGDLEVVDVQLGPDEFRRISSGLQGLAHALAEQRAESRRHLATAEAESGRLAAILTMAREVSGSLNLRYVLQAAGTSAERISGFPSVSIWLLDRADNRLGRAFPQVAGGEQPAWVSLGSGLVGQAARFGRPMADRPGSGVRRLDPDVDIAALAFPLVVGAEVIGVLELSADGSPQPVDPPTLDALETLCIHAASAVESARLHEITEHQSLTDALTRLPNRRSFDRDLQREVDTSARYGTPVSLVMIDVDHFKRFNDRWGHQRGDEVLQEVASVLRSQARSTDTVYRFGGEELVVIARSTPAADAHELAERLRARIERHFPDDGDGGGVTASFGVSTIRPGWDPAALVASADAALYEAKQAGRNRVAVATDARVRT